MGSNEKKVRRQQADPWNKPACFFLAFALLLFIAAGLVHHFRVEQRGSVTTGVVIDIREWSDRTLVRCARVEYFVGGKRYTTDQNNYPGNCRVGDKVQVKYDERHPGTATVLWRGK